MLILELAWITSVGICCSFGYKFPSQLYCVSYCEQSTIVIPLHFYHINFEQEVHVNAKVIDSLQVTVKSELYLPEQVLHMNTEVIDSTQVAINTCVATKPMNNAFQKQSVEVLSVDNNQEDEPPKELVWVRFGKLSLTRFQRDEIEVGHRLKDYHINFAQAIIKNQFSIEGLQCTLLQKTHQTPNNKLQIIHSRGNHWIVACVLFSAVGSVDVYDSMYDTLDNESIVVIRYSFQNPNICSGEDTSVFTLIFEDPITPMFIAGVELVTFSKVGVPIAGLVSIFLAFSTKPFCP